MPTTDWSINLQDPITAQPLVVIFPHLVSARPRLMQLGNEIRDQTKDERRERQREELFFRSREWRLTCPDFGIGYRVMVMWFGNEPGKTLVYGTIYLDLRRSDLDGSVRSCFGHGARLFGRVR